MLSFIASHSKDIPCISFHQIKVKKNAKYFSNRLLLAVKGKKTPPENERGNQNTNEKRLLY
jgi:hypothetical protein